MPNAENRTPMKYNLLAVRSFIFIIFVSLYFFLYTSSEMPEDRAGISDISACSMPSVGERNSTHLIRC